MELSVVDIEKPEAVSVIIGQSHFVKTVEDIHETMVNSVPGIRFGLAFCEASGPRLVRTSGTDDALREVAGRNALAISAGHVFVLHLAEGFYPINVLNSLKMVPEVCRVFCATANDVQVVIAETDRGRGVLGVIDGQTQLGIEKPADEAARARLLRKIGYKLPDGRE